MLTSPDFKDLLSLMGKYFDRCRKSKKTKFDPEERRI